MTLKDTMMPLMSSFHGNATFGATSPASRGYQSANSPGPNGHEIYSEHGYVQASSPQPIQVTMNRVRTQFFISSDGTTSVDQSTFDRITDRRSPATLARFYYIQHSLYEAYLC